MKLITTDIPEIVLLEPTVFGDDRGFFLESYNQRTFAELTGSDVSFVQDNHSRSARHVLRGLHYQIEQAQGKLVRVVIGRIFDVAVDIRRSSPTFGRWVGYELSAENHRQMWIPAGFAHGFMVLSDSADVSLQNNRLLCARARTLHRLERSGYLGIAWPDADQVQLSAKDEAGKRLSEADTFA